MNSKVEKQKTQEIFFILCAFAPLRLCVDFLNTRSKK